MRIGSDQAIWGYLYCCGQCGMPKDIDQAKYWYKISVDGICTVKHLAREGIDDAKERLREIEDGE